MWNCLLEQFESIAERDDASLLWSFDASLRSSHTKWSLAGASSDDAEQQLWWLFAAAGSALTQDRLSRLTFPQKLIQQPSPQQRWFAALRYSGINVDRLSQSPYRTEHGIIRSVAQASAMLCGKLAARGRRDRRRSRLAVQNEARERESRRGLA